MLTDNENLDPERITLSLSVLTDDKVTYNKKVTVKRIDKKKLADIRKDTIIEYLTDHVNAKSSELAKLLGVRSARIKRLLSELVEDGIAVAEGTGRDRTYRLREKSSQT